MTWTLDEWIRAHLQMSRLNLLEVPDLLAQLWQRGQAAGFPLRTLYVLDRPLSSDATGSYEPETGDAWVWLADNEAAAARTLLYLLARARRGTTPVTSIDQDVDVRQEIYREVAALAVEWGFADLISAEWVSKQCDAVEAHRDLLHVAAELAGSKHPGIARAAFHILQDLAATRDWSLEQLSDAMYGTADDETANLDVLSAFDRTRLRGGWSLFRPGGDFNVRQIELTRQIGEWLRSALRSVAERPQMLPAREIGDEWLQRIWFIDVGGRHQLRDAIAICNALLLDRPKATADASWWLYSEAGKDGPRYYRLQVRYAAADPMEVWILVMPQHQQRVVEGALQLYIQGWLRCTEVFFAPLSEGLQTLTNLLAGREPPTDQ